MDVTTKRCDVCKRLEAKTIGITIGVENPDATTLAEYEVVVPRKIDLCESCLQRLGRYIARGTTPPKKRKAKDGNDISL